MSEAIRGELETDPAEVFRKYLPGVCGAAVALCLSAYLLLPLFQSPKAPGTGSGGQASYNLDCFLMRDSSGSADLLHYGSIEQEILSHLSTKGGDRISYAVFGSGTVPEEVEPPSADQTSIRAQRQLASEEAHRISGTTDFALLFDRLRDAIRVDRQRQKATKREPHADAVIILSDGIPDLTPDNQRCPRPGEELIPDDIVDSYKALMNSLYATQEAIYVRLILVGTPSLCGPRIKEEWERRLGPEGLEVISYSEIDSVPHLGEKLLRPLRRHPRVLLRIGSLKDQERRKLDRGDKFSVQFSAQSFLKGGTVRIESAALVGEEGRQLPLHALKNSRVSSTDSRHFPVILVPSPAAEMLWGEPVDQEELYLQPDHASADFEPIESETYQLLVKASVLEQPEPGLPVPSVESDPIEIRPCNKAEQKKLVRERLKLPGMLSLALAGFFSLGALAWFATRKTSRLHAFLEGVFILPYRRWVWVFFFLLIPVSLGFLGLGKTWLFSVLLVLGYLLFLLERSKRSPAAHLAFRLIEFIALPLITEVAAQYLT